MRPLDFTHFSFISPLYPYIYTYIVLVILQSVAILFVVHIKACICFARIVKICDVKSMDIAGRIKF